MAEEEKGQLHPKTKLVGVGVESVTEKRMVKLTPKALLEKISSLEKERKLEFGKLSKVKESIFELMGDKMHVHEVENEFNRLIGLCDKIQQAHASLLGLLPADEANKHETWYQAKMLDINDFIVGTKGWLSEVKACAATKVGDVTDEHVGHSFLGQTKTQTVQHENETGTTETYAVVDNERDDSQTAAVNNGNGAAVGKDEEKEYLIQPEDSISNVQSINHRSCIGSSISGSSTSSARLRARAEQAALLARAAALKDKHALEEQELTLRRKREQLELDTEIAATHAKLAVLQVASSIHSRQSNGMASYIRKGAKPKPTNTSFKPVTSVCVPPPSQQHASLPKPTTSQGSQLPQLPSRPTVSQSFQPTPSQQVFIPLQEQNQTAGLYNLLQQQNDITSLLVQTQTSQLLPRREIPIYDGDPLQFNSFIKAFEHCVEAKTSCKGDCLYYLEQFTRGQPRDIVRSCLHMTADKGFDVAKRLLKEHFGNEFLITAAYMEKVTGHQSAQSLRTFPP